MSDLLRCAATVRLLRDDRAPSPAWLLVLMAAAFAVSFLVGPPAAP